MSAADTTSVTPILRMEGIVKQFPGTLALDKVDFEIRPGEIHALVGHNGSGKSTLIKILAGIYDADEGAITVRHETLSNIGTAGTARRLGCRFVHQDLGLVGMLSAVENLALGRGFQTGFGGRIQWSKEVEAATERMAELGYDFDVTLPVDTLSASQRAGLAIARALYDWEEATVLVVDEPTAALPRAETDGLFEAIERARAKGLGILYVSHRLDEVFRIADRVTVLRDGRKVGTYAVADLDKDELISLMIGGEQLEAHARSGQAVERREGLLETRSLSGAIISDLDLSVAGGEVLGIAGLTGSGREEILKLLFGALPRTGEIFVAGQAVPSEDPRAAVRCGIGLVPADRHQEGCIDPLSVRFNCTLTDVWRHTNRLGAINRRAERDEVEGWVETLEVRPPRPDNEFSLLSGGNQQKVVMSKWLRMEPKVLLLDDPTQGVDIHSKAVLHRLAREVASTGSAVVVASSEDDELCDICDRVIVMRDGTIVGELSGGEIAPDRIGRLEIDFQASAAGADGMGERGR